MKKWYKNITNTITILWLESSNPILEISYKLDNSNNWNIIGNPTIIDVNLYSINNIFVTSGDYIIRVTDTNTNISIYESLHVNDISSDVLLTDINNKIDNKGFV